MKKKYQQIPALTRSGGTLKSLKDAKEFRVWVHPKKGDDYYYASPKVARAIALGERAFSKKEGYVEIPLAVIWDKKHQDYREVQIPAKILRKVY